jgi:hypothetical protein
MGIENRNFTGFYRIIAQMIGCAGREITRVCKEMNYPAVRHEASIYDNIYLSAASCGEFNPTVSKLQSLHLCNLRNLWIKKGLGFTSCPPGWDNDIQNVWNQSRIARLNRLMLYDLSFAYTIFIETRLVPAHLV